MGRKTARFSAKKGAASGASGVHWGIWAFVGVAGVLCAAYPLAQHRVSDASTSAVLLFLHSVEGAQPRRLARLQASLYPELGPLRVGMGARDAFKHLVLPAVYERGWRITEVDEEGLGVQGVAETRVLKWRDDVVVRVEAEEGAWSLVHMRSRSREGGVDFGANKRRIEAFFGALAQLYRNEVLASP